MFTFKRVHRKVWSWKYGLCIDCSSLKFLEYFQEYNCLPFQRSFTTSKKCKKQWPIVGTCSANKIVLLMTCLAECMEKPPTSAIKVTSSINICIPTEYSLKNIRYFYLFCPYLSQSEIIHFLLWFFCSFIYFVLEVLLRNSETVTQFSKCELGHHKII